MRLQHQVDVEHHALIELANWERNKRFNVIYVMFINHIQFFMLCVFKVYIRMQIDFIVFL